MIREAPIPDVLNAKQAAIFIHVDPKSLLRLCQRRKIPFRRVGRVYRFSKSALERWLDPPLKK